MLQVADEAAIPSICEALQQPRMVCDWQEDKHEQNPRFHNFSKLPHLLTPLRRDLRDEENKRQDSGDVELYGRMEFLRPRLSGAQFPLQPKWSAITECIPYVFGISSLT